LDEENRQEAVDAVENEEGRVEGLPDRALTTKGGKCKQSYI
jgi:hypothetical protein